MFLPVSLRQWECISLNSSWTERSGNTERFMPIGSELLTMSPSVCRSAPLCFSTSMRLYFTEFILNGTERQYRKNYAHKKWAISNVSFSLPLRSDNEFVLFGTEQNGITERFMPIRSELLAMCPSVCRSAPTMNLSCSERNRTALQKNYRFSY
jgi:hypothetical protein